MAEEKVVRLNVGGVSYQTSLATLGKYPKSILAATSKLKKDENGSTSLTGMVSCSGKECHWNIIFLSSYFLWWEEDMIKKGNHQFYSSVC